jgi:hypothetical protein
MNDRLRGDTPVATRYVPGQASTGAVLTHTLRVLHHYYSTALSHQVPWHCLPGTLGKQISLRQNPGPKAVVPDVACHGTLASTRSALTVAPAGPEGPGCRQIVLELLADITNTLGRLRHQALAMEASCRSCISTRDLDVRGSACWMQNSRILVSHQGTKPAVKPQSGEHGWVPPVVGMKCSDFPWG